MIHNEWDLFLIGSVILIAYPVSRLNIGLATFRIMFLIIVTLVIFGSLYLLKNPEHVVHIASVFKAYFGHPDAWVGRSYVFKENIVACYYILILGSCLIFLVSCAREHNGMSRFRNAGAINMAFVFIIILMVFYYIFYIEIGYDAGFIGRKMRVLYNSGFGLMFWHFVILIMARDAGKIYRVLANPHCK